MICCVIRQVRFDRCLKVGVGLSSVVSRLLSVGNNETDPSLLLDQQAKGFNKGANDHPRINITQASLSVPDRTLARENNYHVLAHGS